jgi:hypothetical protein
VTAPDPGTPAAAARAAWLELDAAERAFPECEHIREWRALVGAARVRHRAALSALDAAAARGHELRAAPSSLPLEPAPVDDGALFPLEHPGRAA